MTNGTPNNGWKAWQVKIALISLILAALSVMGRSVQGIFLVGGATAQQDERISQLSKRVDRLEQNSVQKDIFESDIAGLNQRVSEVRDEQHATNDLLQKLLMQTRR